MQVQIRAATMADHDQVRNVLEKAFDEYVKLLGREQTSNEFHHLEKSIEDDLVILTIVEQKVAGALCATPVADGLMIEELGVDPNFHQMGIGRKILTSYENHARKKGVRYLYLVTAERIEHLVRFYSGFGFQITKRALPEHGKDNNIRVHMRKEL